MAAIRKRHMQLVAVRMQAVVRVPVGGENTVSSLQMRFAQGKSTEPLMTILPSSSGAVLAEDKIASQGDAPAPGEIHPPRAGEIGGMGERAEQREQQTGDTVVFMGFRLRIGFRARPSGSRQQNEDRPLMQRGFKRDFFPPGENRAHLLIDGTASGMAICPP